MNHNDDYVMNNTQRVLLSAIACDPSEGSEPYVGWNWAHLLATKYHVHVLTREIHRKTIIAATSINHQAVSHQIKFHFFDLPLCSRMGHRHRLMRMYCVVWELCAIVVALGLHVRYRFDVAHHLTYNTIEMPGYLWLLPRCRFVWGPIGAGHVAPKAFAKIFGRSWRQERLRTARKQAISWNPLIRIACRRASLLMCANKETFEIIARLQPNKTFLIVETAITPNSKIKLPDTRHNNDYCRALWIGVLEPFKGLELAIRALHILHSEDIDDVPIMLDVYGTGSQNNDAHELVKNLGLENVVNFRGHVSRTTIMTELKSADMLIFTSLRDTSGNVLLEAMSNAVPVIALKHQGAAQLIQGGGGILIDPVDIASTCREMACAMRELATDPKRRLELGHAALREVLKRHTWEARKSQAMELYKQYVG